MSAIVNCPACVMGEHEDHVGPWNVKPGLIGGSTCECPGDCRERGKAAFERLFGTPTRPYACRACMGTGLLVAVGVACGECKGRGTVV